MFSSEIHPLFCLPVIFGHRTIRCYKDLNSQSKQSYKFVGSVFSFLYWLVLYIQHMWRELMKGHRQRRPFQMLPPQLCIVFLEQRCHLLLIVMEGFKAFRPPHRQLNQPKEWFVSFICESTWFLWVGIQSFLGSWYFVFAWPCLDLLQKPIGTKPRPAKFLSYIDSIIQLLWFILLCLFPKEIYYKPLGFSKF